MVDKYFAERKLDEIMVSWEYRKDVFVRRVRLVGFTVLPTVFITFVVTIVGGVAFRSGGGTYAFLKPLKLFVLHSERVAARLMGV